MNPFSRFFLGFLSFFDGFKMLAKDKSLKKLAAIPILIDVLIFVGIAYTFFVFVMPHFLETILSPASGFWGKIARIGGYGFASVISLLLSGVLTFLLAQIVASPFNTLLAEKTLKSQGLLKGQPDKSWLKGSLKMLFSGLIRGAILLLLGVLIFVLGFIPLLNVLALFMGLFLMATDCADYSHELLHMEFRKRAQFYVKFWLEFLGFGCAMGLTFMVPGLNLVMIPALSISGALLVSRLRTAQ